MWWRFRAPHTPSPQNPAPITANWHTHTQRGASLPSCNPLTSPRCPSHYHRYERRTCPHLGHTSREWRVRLSQVTGVTASTTQTRVDCDDGLRCVTQTAPPRTHEIGSFHCVVHRHKSARSSAKPAVSHIHVSMIIQLGWTRRHSLDPTQPMAVPRAHGKFTVYITHDRIVVCRSDRRPHAVGGRVERARPSP